MTKSKNLFLITLFLLFISLLSIAADIRLPSATDWIVDEANILSTSTMNNLRRYREELKQKTGAEIAIVTVISLQNYPIEEYSIRLAEKWKVGQKDKDNGVILLVALNERRVRIEVGYGLEGIIPDGRAGDIIRNNILPAFRNNDYNKGVFEGALTIMGLVAQEYNVVLEGMPEKYYSQHNGSSANDLFSGIITLIILISLVILFIKNPSLFILFLLMSGGSRRSRSGGFGGSFNSGSFGGFGGGGFGGGGASGGW